MQRLKDSKHFLISYFDGKAWADDEAVPHTPIPRVRQLLGGRWENKKDFDDQGIPAAAFFNGDKRVLVLGFKPETTAEGVQQALRQIREGREDRS